jgi:hypothetical protein
MDKVLDVNNITDDSMLSTSDNPYNPFLQWDEWYAFDTSKGYHTCAYLARVCKSSPELSEVDQNLSISEAIDKIIALNLLGIYIKVNRNDFKVKVK